MAKLRAVSTQIWRRCLLYEPSRSHFKSLIFCAAYAFMWLTSNCAGAYAGPGRERRRYILHVFASAKGVLAALQLLCAPPRALRPQACQRHAAPAVSFHRRAPQGRRRSIRRGIVQRLLSAQNRAHSAHATEHVRYSPAAASALGLAVLSQCKSVTILAGASHFSS